MAHDDRTSQEQLTPDDRRQMLRAFGDRMLIKLSSMDDPEDMPGVERAVRAAAAIERIYSRCDRAESHAPDPRKLEAERATNTQDAIKARVHLAGTLQWGEQRRRDLGPWWDAAETKTDTQTQALATAPGLPQVSPLAATPSVAQTGLEAKTTTPLIPNQSPTPSHRRFNDAATALLRVQTHLGTLDKRDGTTVRPLAAGHGPPSG